MDFFVALLIIWKKNAFLKSIKSSFMIISEYIIIYNYWIQKQTIHFDIYSLRIKYLIFLYKEEIDQIL